MIPDDDYRNVLKLEFADEGDGSFMIQMRCALFWDRAAFSRLVAAMEACCKDQEGKESVDRWIAEGFWYLSWFVKEWATHPNFPKVEPPDYYEKAFERLFDLAYWFFFSESPYLPGHELERL